MKHLRNLILLLMLVSPSTVFAVGEVSHPVQDHTDPVGKMVTLTVKVVNATEAGTKVEGDTAFAFIFHHSEQLASMETTVDSNGTAVFKDISTGRHFQVVARVKHSNMMFGGQAVSLDTSADAVNAQVEVYDVGFDNSVIKIGSHDMNVKIEGESLLVTEYMQLINDTGKAVTSSNMDASDKPKVIEISLPAGFSDFKCVKYFAESALVVTADGFYDTMAMPPGILNAAFTYKIDLGDKDFWDFQKKITIPTMALQVYSQLGGGVLEGLGQVVGISNAPDGAQAQKYAASSYKVGDMLVFQVRNNGSNPILIVVISVIALVVLIVAAKLISSRNKRNGVKE